MSSKTDRVFSEEEWEDIRKSWEVDYENTIKTLRLVSRGYSPRSWKRKGLEEVISREASRQKLLLMLIEVLRKVDETLHPRAQGGLT